ncbi:MAG: tRNA pseudouridine(55) synthase TruB [Candidatus Omnitrophota bacterium]
MYNGIVVVDKPKGFTSHDIVLFLRRRFGIKKVGHAGTLDPMATGVLVLLLGDATKLSNSFISDDKEYEGTMRLGAKTTTCDAEGEITATNDISGVTPKIIEEAASHFRATIDQVPPMFSALKRGGRKLYKLARKGIEIELEPRKVTVFALDIKKIELPDVWFKVACSKGTYVRKLAEDIGEKIGCGAHLVALRRTKSGRFSIEDAVGFEALKNYSEMELERRLIRLR